MTFLPRCARLRQSAERNIILLAIGEIWFMLCLTHLFPCPYIESNIFKHRKPGFVVKQGHIRKLNNTSWWPSVQLPLRCWLQTVILGLHLAEFANSFHRCHLVFDFGALPNTPLPKRERIRQDQKRFGISAFSGSGLRLHFHPLCSSLGKCLITSRGSMMYNRIRLG